MYEDLTPLQALKELKQNIKDGSHLFDDELLNIIEIALKDYRELLQSQCVLVGRTNGQTQKIIDTICKHYKEIRISNLEDKEKIKALEIIKNNFEISKPVGIDIRNNKVAFGLVQKKDTTIQEYDLVKRMFID